MSAETAPIGPWPGLAGLDRVLEHRARFGICVLLGRNTRMTFRHLKDLLDETDGNLGAHLKKLEDAGYLDVRKTFQGRKPVKWYSLTKRGRAALERHLDTLARIVREAHTTSETDT